jgi:hypothetical protein
MIAGKYLFSATRATASDGRKTVTDLLMPLSPLSKILSAGFSKKYTVDGD